MADSSNAEASASTISIKDKLRQMRVASALRRDATRSPSTIPNKEPEQIPVLTSSDDTPISGDRSLPMRAPEPLADPISDAELAPSAVSSSGNLSQQTSSSMDSIKPLLLGTREYAIPLPMHARIAKQYEQTLIDYEADIEAFIRAVDPLDNDLIVKMDMLVDRLNNLIKAPDLINISVEEDQNVSPITAAGWAESCSSKFVFLNDLLESLRSQQIHIVLFAASGRFMDYVETFLIGRQFLYKRPDKIAQSPENAAGPLTITLLPTGEDGVNILAPGAAAIIAMDNTFSTDDRQVDAIRMHLLGDGVNCPIIHLLVPNSPEHIDLCISKTLPPGKRLQALVSCVDQLRRQIGHGDIHHDPDDAGSSVASFIVSKGADTEWPLTPMLEIPGIEGVIEEALHPSMPLDIPRSPDPTPVVAGTTKPTSKRRLEVDDEENNVIKRHRSTPLPEVQSSILKSTEIEMAPGAQVLEELDASALIALPEIPASPILRAEIATLELQLSEHVSAIDSLQERFEARSKEARLYLKERDAALAAAKTADARREDHIAIIASLKQERSRLENALTETSKALQASTIPEAAALERARAESRAALAAQQKAEKRLESMKKDFEFTRQQYQTASTAAAESASEIMLLKEENEKLKKQASGEVVKLRELNSRNANTADADRISLLEAMLEDREAIIIRKEEELRNIGRGRGLATRATSVPKSPKAFSRPTSPAPGFLGPGAGRAGHVGFHPLRNG